MSLHMKNIFLSKWSPSLGNAVLFAFTLFLCLCHVRCEEECLKSKVWCYECESSKDPYCSDPFNASIEMHSMKMCEGCCVKIVQNINTPNRNIWRTCTSRIQINLFMVDHVCMEESGGLGHMCFCESDACNGSPPTVRPQASLIRAAILLSTLSFFVHSSFFISLRLSHSMC